MQLSWDLFVAASLFVTMLAQAESQSGVDPDTEAWARVLASYHHAGGVDYEALMLDRGDLDRYLSSLGEVSLEGWSREQKIAFWCNAYNAVVIHFVLESLPGLGSVKDVPGFFDELTFKVAGRERTLDEIETAARDLEDPRVHFAVVCASTSCPDLQPEPFRAVALDSQLEAATRQFLEDSSKGLRWAPEDEQLLLSSIFKWYAGDFTGGSTVVAFFARGALVEWLLPHLPTELAEELRRAEPSVRYMDYDWTLNQRSRP